MADEKDRDPRDVQAGENLAILRGDMTQSALAAKMRERGWKWSQATVWAIERGDRPLRIAEAVDVLSLVPGAGAGGIEYSLLRPSLTSQLNLRGRAARDAWEAVVAAIVAFRNAQMNLSYVYSQAREEGVELRTGDLMVVESWLDPNSVSQAVEEADERWWRDMTADEDREAPPADFFQGRDTPIWTSHNMTTDDDGVDPEA